MKNRDLHREKAARIFGVKESKVTEDIRNYAKIRAHAENYRSGYISFVEFFKKKGTITRRFK